MVAFSLFVIYFGKFEKKSDRLANLKMVYVTLNTHIIFFLPNDKVHTTFYIIMVSCQD